MNKKIQTIVNLLPMSIMLFALSPIEFILKFSYRTPNLFSTSGRVNFSLLTVIIRKDTMMSQKTSRKHITLMQ